MHNNQDDELDPLFAAGNPFAGGNSKLARSMRARAQRRDSKGRFAWMGGGFSLPVRFNGEVYDLLGRSVGASNKDGFLQLMIPEGDPVFPAGVYDIPSGSGDASVAILPGSSASAPWKGSATDSRIVDFETLTRRDAPEDWTKNEDGSFTTEDGEWRVAPNEDDTWSLSQNDEQLDGSFRDSATAIARATAMDAEDTADEETKKRVATLREEGASQTDIDKVLFNVPELVDASKAPDEDGDDEEPSDNLPAGTKASATFRPSTPNGEPRTETWTKQEDGTWKNDKTGMTGPLPKEWTPEDGFGRGAWSKVTFTEPTKEEKPQAKLPSTRASKDIKDELDAAKEEYEELENEAANLQDDPDREAEIVDRLVELVDEIDALEREYNQARLAELPQEPVAQIEPDTVDSISRRIDRLEAQIQGRIDRGQDYKDLEDEIANLEARRQALIEQGEEDGGESEPTADGGTEGNVPGDLVGEDASGPQLERRGDTLRDVNGNVVATKVDEVANAEEIREGGAKVVDLFEVTPENAEVFRDALIRAAKNNKYGKSVTVYDLEYYQQPGIRMFLTQDGKGGIALKDDEIISGFMDNDAVDRGQGAIQSMIAKMVELGGRRLDAYDTILPELYASAGFKPVARIKWDDEFAPEGWDYDLYEKWNGGRPDIVFMAYDPERLGSEYDSSEGEYVENYDDGLPAQKAALEPVTDEVVTKDLTDRQKAAQARRQAAQEANDALKGGDGLLEGDVPQNARGSVSNQALQLAPIGQVVEATSRNGRKRRFIKVGKDTWKRTDKPDDRKRYRSHELRGGTVTYVPRTENDVPSADETRGPVDRYRPKPFSFPRDASDEELERLREIYAQQAENDDNPGGRLRAEETVRLIEMVQARRAGQPIARRRSAAQRRLDDQRAGLPTTPENIPARRTPRGTAPLLPENDPEAGADTEPQEPTNDMPEGTSNDPKVLAAIFDAMDLAGAFMNAIFNGRSDLLLEFPGEGGQPGPKANVRIEAVRDALQLLGKDTNALARKAMDARARAEQEASEQEATPAAEGENRGDVPEFEPGDRIDRERELGGLYNSLEEITAAIALTDNKRLLVQLLIDRRKVVERIRRLEALGFRNTYNVKQVNLDNFKWNGATPDIHDPNLVLEALKKKYPEATILPNGDILIGENEYVDANGNRFTYQAIITRTDDEMFYTYIREINHAEQDPEKKVRSLRFGVMRHSARATNRQAEEALKRIYNGGKGWDINSWFNDPRRVTKDGRPPKFDIAQEDGTFEHVKDQVFTREAIRRIAAATRNEDITEEMITTLYNYIKSFGNGEEVAARLYESFGLDLETMNRFVDAVNANIDDREGLIAFSKWESDKGIPLAEGDLVEYTGDENQKGYERLNGRKGIVKIRQLEHTVNGRYTYTDYVYIQLLDENGNPTDEEYQIVSSHNLGLIKTAGGTDGTERLGPYGVKVPPPALTVRAVNRYAGQGRWNSIAPYRANFDRDSLASPMVEIDGKRYPVQLSRASVLNGEIEKLSATPRELQAGDFIKTFDEETGLPRFVEVVGIEELEDGRFRVHTVKPINVSSGEVSSTEYDQDAELQLDIYRPIPQEEVDLNAPGLSNNQVARLAELMRSVDPSRLPAESLERIREIVGSTDPASLPYSTRQFADIFMEAFEAQGGDNVAGPISIEEAARIMAELIRNGNPPTETARDLETVRRYATQREEELNPRSTASTRRVSPRRSTNKAPRRAAEGVYRKGPYTSEDGAALVSPEEFAEALRNSDMDVLNQAVRDYAGEKIFGSKFGLANIEVNRFPDGMYWTADITDPATGRKVGSTRRYITIDRNGKITVEHSSLFIKNDRDKGTGFATEFKKISDNFYKSIGVSQINITAVADGAYAWGKANYTWRGRSDADVMKTRLEWLRSSAINNNNIEDAAILEAMIERFRLPFNHPDFPDPIDIANMKKDDGTAWGREIMTGNSWSGVRYLDPDLDPRPQNRKDKGKEPAEAPEPNVGTEGRTGEQISAESEAETPAAEDVPAGPTEAELANPNAPKFDGWTLSETRDADDTQQARREALRTIKVINELRRAQGLPQYEQDQIAELLPRWEALYIAQQRKSYIYTKGDVQVEIDKSMIGDPDLPAAMARIMQLQTQYPPKNGEPVIVRFNNRKNPMTSSDGDAMASFLSSPTGGPMIINVWATSGGHGMKLQNSRDPKWHPPGHDDISDSKYSFTLVHEWGHALDYGMAPADTGLRDMTPQEMREIPNLSVEFKEEVQKYDRENGTDIWNNISSYARGAGDNLAATMLGVSTRERESFAEVFAQMIAEDVYNSEKTEMAQIMRQFLKSKGLLK